MLENYREGFREQANIIKDWEKLSKNELCYAYIEHENNPELQNAYFSALVYRYWPLISKYHYMCSNVASMEDCYDWLIDSITYALAHRRWEDPDSSIYNDPNGPDKVINRYMKCARLTFYQFINRKKRRDNFGMLSLDELLNIVDPTSGCDFINTSYTSEDARIDLYNYIRQLFDKKDYFLAFMIDLIVYGDTFDNDTGMAVFNQKKLVKQLRHLDKVDCQIFAQRYDLDENMVLEYYETYCKNLSSTVMYHKIEFNLLKLKHYITSKKY